MTWRDALMVIGGASAAVAILAACASWELTVSRRLDQERLERIERLIELGCRPERTVLPSAPTEGAL